MQPVIATGNIARRGLRIKIKSYSPVDIDAVGNADHVADRAPHATRSNECTMYIYNHSAVVPRYHWRSVLHARISHLTPLSRTRSCPSRQSVFSQFLSVFRSSSLFIGFRNLLIVLRGGRSCVVLDRLRHVLLHSLEIVLRSFQHA